MAARTPFTTKQRTQLAKKEFRSPSDALSPVSLALAARRKEPQAVKMRELLSADTRRAAVADSVPDAACRSSQQITQNLKNISQQRNAPSRPVSVLSPSTTHRPNLTPGARKGTAQVLHKHNSTAPSQAPGRAAVQSGATHAPMRARTQHSARMVR